MKKKYLIVLSAILLLSGGCSSSGENIEQTTEQERAKTVDVDKLYSANKEYLAQPYWNQACDYIKKTDNGYYFIDGNLLYFWDSAVQEGTVVCSAPNCDHQGSYGNAYIGSYGDEDQYGFVKTGMEIYNDHIYMLGYEMGDVMDFYIYQISMDGSEREKLAYLYTNEKDATGGFMWTYDWIMVNGYYYGAYDGEDGTYGLEKICLDGTRESVYDMSNLDTPNISLIKGYNHDVYFTTEWKADEGNGNYVFRLMKYNIDTGKTETLLENFKGNDYCLTDENHIFYYDINNDCYLIDLTTKEEILVADDMNQLSAVTSDGNYVYLCDYENVYVYDFDGMLTDTIPCPSATVLFGDGEYLFVEAFQEPGTDVEKEGGTMHMWVLDKSQIGSEHKQWMKMELGSDSN